MGSIIDISEVLLELGLSSSVTDEERAIVNTAIVRAEGSVKRHLRYDPVQRTRTEFYPLQDFDYQARDAIWVAEGGQAVLQRLSGVATSELQIRHLPIRSITTLAIDLGANSGTASGAFASDTEKAEGTDFWPNYEGEDSSSNSFCRDGIIRSIGVWPTVPGTVKIVYTAGYSSAELHGQDSTIDASPIMDTVIEEASRRVRKAFVWAKRTGVGFTAGPFTSENLGDYSYSIDGSAAARMFGGQWDILPESVHRLADFVNWGYSLGS